MIELGKWGFSPEQLEEMQEESSRDYINVWASDPSEGSEKREEIPTGFPSIFPSGQVTTLSGPNDFSSPPVNVVSDSIPYDIALATARAFFEARQTADSTFIEQLFCGLQKRDAFEELSDREVDAVVFRLQNDPTLSLVGGVVIRTQTVMHSIVIQPSSYWIENDPVLSLGQKGVDTDKQFLRVGDGVTPWSQLSFRFPLFH